MTDEVAVRFIVSGRVQGVFFRASTARAATRLGLHGHAINLDDGRVEVLAVGVPAAVAELGRWLHRGPPAARVEDVAESAVAIPRGLDGFRTG